MKWKAINTKVTGYGRDIIFANGKYYLAHKTPNGVAHSDDLKNWTDVKLDDTKFTLENLAYGNNTFIASGEFVTGNTNAYIAISTDGINWRYKAIDENYTISTTKFVNNRFILLLSYINQYIDESPVRYEVTYKIFETKDGSDIKTHIFKFSTYDYMEVNFARDIIYSNGKYIIVGDFGLIISSNNLEDWKFIDSGINTSLNSISIGKNLFFIVGADGVILTSTDGMNWNKQNSNVKSYLCKSRYANGMYLAVGYNGTIISSTDAINWIEENDPFKSTTIYGLVFNDNLYIVSAGRYSTGTIPIAYAQISREVSYAEGEVLYIFDKDLNFKGVIDSFISLRWRRKYYEAGEFELVVAPYKNNIDLLGKKDRIIIRQDYSEAAIIDTVSFSDDGKNVELTCSGSFLLYLTKRRIVKKTINYKGNILDAEKTLLREMTPLTDKFEIEETTIQTKDIQFQCTYKNVYEMQCKFSKLSNIGSRIVPNIENKVFRFENYAGIDRTHNQKINEKYCFSTQNHNSEKLELTDTLIGNCNSVLVGGSGEGEERILVEVSEGDYSGFDLFESFLDAKSENKGNLTDSAYKENLKTLGLSKILSEQRSIEITANSVDYRNKWDLGDIVDIQDENWNILESVRITEVEEIIENGKREIKPTFGTPLAETVSLE